MMQAASQLHSADSICISIGWSSSAFMVAQVFEEEENMKDEP